jgi:hypothetical protein
VEPLLGSPANDMAAPFSSAWISEQEGTAPLPILCGVPIQANKGYICEQDAGSRSDRVVSCPSLEVRRAVELLEELHTLQRDLTDLDAVAVALLEALGCSVVGG